MAEIRVKIHRDVLRKIRRGPEVQADLRRRGEKIAKAAGPGYGIDPFVGKERARVGVRTEGSFGRYKEATEGNLARSLEAGRE